MTRNPPLKRARVRFGDLDAIVVEGAARVGRASPAVVVLLHGYGAAGDDLVPFAAPLAEAAPGARFVFLEAPHELGFEFLGGRAWWHIDFAARLRRQEATGSLDLEEPEGLESARLAVTGALDAIARELAPERLVLGGFSQGAMLSLDVALRDGRVLDGLVLLSGTRLDAPAWPLRMPTRKGLRVFMSHGRTDELLSFAVSAALRKELVGHGLEVTWVTFPEGHGIPDGVTRELAGFLERTLGQHAR